jgi:hypothetical protein
MCRPFIGSEDRRFWTFVLVRLVLMAAGMLLIWYFPWEATS